MEHQSNLLTREFYARPTMEVARDLLGRILVRVYHGKRLSGRIVETEAYLGANDPASHAYRGLSPRNRVMFGPPGFAYVYFIYGMHYCLNIVTESNGVAGAVLIRALEPLEGIEIMQELRGGRPVEELTNGPAKLAQALALDISWNGTDLCASPDLFLEEGTPVPDEMVMTAPRIGLSQGATKDAPWRFVVTGNPFVSHPPWKERKRIKGL